MWCVHDIDEWSISDQTIISAPHPTNESPPCKWYKFIPDEVITFVCGSILAEWSTSTSATGTWSSWAARWSGRNPLLDSLSGPEPLSSKRATILSCPSWQARCSGVKPDWKQKIKKLNQSTSWCTWNLSHIITIFPHFTLSHLIRYLSPVVFWWGKN